MRGALNVAMRFSSSARSASNLAVDPVTGASFTARSLEAATVCHGASPSRSSMAYFVGVRSR
jgi:hypothetical protein